MKKPVILFLSLIFLTLACQEDDDQFDPFAKFSIEMTAFTDSTITYQFINESENASKYQWDFGDNLATDEKNPLHQYTSEGSYNITLYAINEINEQDTAMRSIEVDFEKLPPLALFNFESISVDSSSASIQFINLSEHALTYKWEFGDTSCSEQMNPVHVYNYEGIYKVKLKAFNADLDADSTTRQVEITFSGE